MRIEATSITNANAGELLAEGSAAIARGDFAFDLQAVTEVDTAAIALLLPAAAGCGSPACRPTSPAWRASTASMACSTCTGRRKPEGKVAGPSTIRRPPR
jgi:hypothetical protein